MALMLMRAGILKIEGATAAILPMAAAGACLLKREESARAAGIGRRNLFLISLLIIVAPM